MRPLTLLPATTPAHYALAGNRGSQPAVGEGTYLTRLEEHNA